MAGHVYVNVTGFGWGLLPHSPFRMEQVSAEPPVLRVEYLHPDGTRAATLRIDSPDIRVATEPRGTPVEEVVEILGGRDDPHWLLETTPFVCAWPTGFALTDEIKPFCLRGLGAAMVWVQGPVPAERTPPPEGLAAPGQTILSITELGEWARIELAYEHEGQPWRQIHRIRDTGPERKIGVTSQAPLSVAPEAGAAGDLVATSMRTNVAP